MAPGFAEIIKERNKLARLMGFEDFYDYKVRTAALYNMAAGHCCHAAWYDS